MPKGKGYGRRMRPRRMFRKKNNYKAMAGHRSGWLEKASGYVGSIGRLAGSVLALKKLVNSETKYVDSTSSGVVTSTGATLGVSLSTIAQGDDYNNRSGRSILLKSLSVNLAFTINVTAVTTFLHWAIVMDKKPDAGSTNHDTVYGSSSGYLSQIDKALEGDRYVVLRHNVEKMSINGDNLVSQRIFIDLSGIHQLFDGTASTAFEKNVIYFVAVSDQATNTPSYNLNARIRFYDN